MSEPGSEEERTTRKRVPSVVLREKGLITLPLSLREELDLETGDTLLWSIEDGRIVLTPAAVVPRVQLPEPPPEPPTVAQLEDEARELCESFGPQRSAVEEVSRAGISGQEAIDAGFPEIIIKSMAPSPVLSAPVVGGVAMVKGSDSNYTVLAISKNRRNVTIVPPVNSDGGTPAEAVAIRDSGTGQYWLGDKHVQFSQPGRFDRNPGDEPELPFTGEGSE